MFAFEDLPIPERSPREWFFAATLFAIAVVWHMPQFSFVSMNPDEGIVLQGAHRVLHGAVPYRDFFAFYTPGAYYWAALLFRVFGESILVTRAALLLYTGIVAALAYMLTRRLSSRYSAVLSTYLLLLIWPFKFFTLHNWDSTVFALGALYSLVWLLQSPHWVPAGATGALTACTILIEQSKGAGLLLGFATGLLFLSCAGHLGLRRSHWLVAAAAFTAPFAATVAYFGTQHSIAAMVEACAWPLRHYSAANHLPYGASIFLTDFVADFRNGTGFVYCLTLVTVAVTAVIIPAIPLGIVLFVAIRVPIAWRQQTATAADRFFVFSGLAACGLLFAMIMTRRPDLPHIVYLAPLFWFLLPSLVTPRAVPGAARATKLALIAAFVAFTVFGLVVEWPSITARQAVQTRRGRIRMQSADQVIGYIQQNLPPGSKLLVHPYHPLYLFLTATDNESYYEYLQAGMHTRQQFERVVADLASKRNIPVLLDLGFADKIRVNWPSTPATALASDPVTDYVLASYHPCKILNPGGAWTFVYMVPEGFACPVLTAAESIRPPRSASTDFRPAEPFPIEE